MLFLFTLIIMFSILVWGFLVLRASNAVHSVLSLVMVFALTAILFLLLGAEFFALLLFTVYIGAIAILFLFVIMMLDLRLAELHGSAYYHVPLGASIGLAFLMAIYSFLAPEFFNLAWSDYSLYFWQIHPQSNLKALGQVLYNYYIPFVLLITLILLLAMIAVIALTLEDKKNSSSFSQTQQRYSKSNIYWYTFQQCLKGPSVNVWWAPLHPSLAHTQWQARSNWRKWPRTQIKSSSAGDADA